MTEAARREHREILTGLVYIEPGACWVCGGTQQIHVPNRTGQGRTVPETCPRCRGTGKAKGLPMSGAVADPERRKWHGTRAAYGDHDCRCLECRQAFAVYRRGLREAKR